MKKRIARLLRRGANRLDPPPKPSIWAQNTTTSTSGHGITLTLR